MRIRFARLWTLAGLAVAAPSALGQASLTGPLGWLPGTNISIGLGLSDNGNVACGYGYDLANFTQRQAWRWVRGSGMVGLGDLPGGDNFSMANAISADGSVVAGESHSSNGREAFRWTQASGMVGLGDLAGGQFNSSVNAISADGTTIVGIATPSSGVRAFRWTAATGIQSIGDLPGGATTGGASEATAVNADGSVVVGLADVGDGYHAFRWTAAEGMVDIGDLPGSNVFAVASAVTPDGAVIVGESTATGGSFAWRWTQATGMVSLGDLAGGDAGSSAADVSDDGNWIVGVGTTTAGVEAIIWHPSIGMKSLKSYLTERGANLTGWTLLRAVSISGDGRYVVGTADHPGGIGAAYIADLGTGEFRWAQYVSQTPPPTTIVAGTKANVAVTFKNSGTIPWTAAGKYYLGSRNPVDNLNWGARRIAMPSGTTVNPGSNYTFSWEATAPWEPGTYNFQWKVLSPNGWFGDLSANRSITVTRATNAGVFMSQSGIPTTIAPGGTFTASITMKNTGTASWTTATGFKLGSWSPTNNTVWGSKRWDMPAGSNIPTNGQVTFTRTFTAPATPGTYVFQWRMIKSGVSFFGTTSTAVKVTVQ